jgi:hypothetical protein
MKGALGRFKFRSDAKIFTLILVPHNRLGEQYLYHTKDKGADMCREKAQIKKYFPEMKLIVNWFPNNI